MVWQEIKIETVHEGIEPLTGALSMIGIESVKIDDSQDFEEFLEETKEYYDCIDDEVLALKHQNTTITVYVPKTAEGAEQVAHIRQMLTQLKEDRSDLGSLAMQFTDIREEDWANEWKRYFKPVTVSDFVTIKPTWEEYTPGDDEIVVEIDPGMAFGTGTHESTKMCIQLLEQFIEPGMEVADIGCGSGILSIVAAKFGAENILAIDRDEVAVEVTKENAALNGCQIEVKQGDLTEHCQGRKFDVIVANIIADVIIRLNQDVTNYMKKSGMYICSGIIDSRLKDVEESLKGHQFKIIDILEQGDWRALACKYRG